MLACVKHRLMREISFLKKKKDHISYSEAKTSLTSEGGRKPAEEALCFEPSLKASSTVSSPHCATGGHVACEAVISEFTPSAEQV